MSQQPPRIALVWAQFGAYHVDRCEAVGQHLGGEADVLAVEVASRSRYYLWEPSGDVQCARKVTLFPDGCYEDIPVTRRARALFSVLRRCDIAYFGIGYNELYVILVAWLLRLMGKRVVMMTDSKFEDMPRSVWFEMFKSAVLFVFQGAIVAGHRQESYLRFLGFRKRPIMLGYDVVSGERLARQALANRPSVSIADEDRPFICVARMVPKKNLFTLLDAYAAYRDMVGIRARRLLLVGSGPLESDLCRRMAELGIADMIDMPGFLASGAVAGLVSGALALILISTEEQWGLVVNEAVLLGLPVIVSEQVGACDLLVRNMVNGFVVSSDCAQAVAMAMERLSLDSALRETMSANSKRIGFLADTHQFAVSTQKMTTMLI